MKKAVIYGNSEVCRQAYTEKEINALQQIVKLYPHIIEQAEFETHRSAMAEAEIIYTASGILPLKKEQVEQWFPKAKLLLYMGGTVKYFARGFLDNGVYVVSGWIANGIPVAEFAAAQIVLCGRGFYRLNQIYKREGYNSARKVAMSYPGNRKAKFGILGAGAIGKEVVKILQRFQTPVYVYDPFLSQNEAERLQVVKTSLADIFENCDTISNHLANVPETIGILNESLFCKMKPNGVFINTARGAQVDVKGLVKAMKEEPARLALIDVSDPEEPLPDEHPFRHTENIWITPHIAGTYEESYPLMFHLLWEETMRYLKGQPLVYAVNNEQLKTMA